MKQLTPRRTFTLFLLMAMMLIGVLAGAGQALALDTGGATAPGSITVHTYKTTTPSTVPGTGAEGQAVEGESLAGVGYTLYKLDIAKVETGAGVTAPDYAGKPLTETPSAGEALAIAEAYGDGTGGIPATTDAEGIATFSNLGFGYYLLVQVHEVEGAAAAVPSIITLPYASEMTGGAVTYLTDVHVYPKNVSTDLVSKKEMSGKKYVEIGDELSYRITFGAPLPGAVYESDSAYAKAKITDILPTDAADNALVDYKVSSAKVYAVLADGTLKSLAEEGFTATEPDTSAAGKLVWDYTSSPAFAKAIKQANEKNPDNLVAHVAIDIEVTVNERAVNPAESDKSQVPAINNKVGVSLTDAAGAALIEGEDGKAESGDLYSAGFGFYKVNAAAERLAGAEFVISVENLGTSYSTEGGNLKGVLLKKGASGASKDNWLTSSSATGTGFVSFGSLTGYKNSEEHLSFQYWDGMKLADYTALHEAAETVAKGGPAQDIDLWLIETEAPEGYQKMQRAIPVTLEVSRIPGSGNVAFKVKTVDGQSIGADGFTVENTRYGEGAFALPNTGGMGATLIVLAGVAAIGVAVTLVRRGKEGKRASVA